MGGVGGGKRWAGLQHLASAALVQMHKNLLHTHVCCPLLCRELAMACPKRSLLPAGPVTLRWGASLQVKGMHKRNVYGAMCLVLEKTKR